jgi:hypothetical protein
MSPSIEKYLHNKSKPSIDYSTQRDQSSLSKSYLNTTGPGDYDLPPLIGNKNHDSLKTNVPAYSFPTKSNKSIISKEHVQVSFTL